MTVRLVGGGDLVQLVGGRPNVGLGRGPLNSESFLSSSGRWRGGEDQFQLGGLVGRRRRDFS